MGPEEKCPNAPQLYFFLRSTFPGDTTFQWNQLLGRKDVKEFVNFPSAGQVQGHQPALTLNSTFVPCLGNEGTSVLLTCPNLHQQSKPHDSYLSFWFSFPWSPSHRGFLLLSPTFLREAVLDLAQSRLPFEDESVLDSNPCNCDYLCGDTR